jgi:hypothetical protein
MISILQPIDLNPFTGGDVAAQAPSKQLILLTRCEPPARAHPAQIGQTQAITGRQIAGGNN